MSKRRADIELNQDNWDDELPAVSGTGASDSIDKSAIANRKILVPKSRRSTNTSGLFKSLSGFSSTSPAVSAFSFDRKASVENPLHSSTITNSDVSKETEYLKELQTLNQNLLEWVEKHVKSDPHCILTPVFTDYEKHLKELHQKYPDQQPAVLCSKLDSVSTSAPPAPVNGVCKIASEIAEPPKQSLFPPLISQPAVSTDVSKPTFSFSLPPLTSSSSAPPLFKFGNTLPSSSPFSQATSVDNPAPTQDDDNEEYQPPKPVVREIKEDGSVYTVRCKLFYKSGSEWRERGVGNLFIKPQTEEKFQLLIRADTNLGNILLNVMITKDIPIKTQKNNVTLVCVPTPPIPSVKAPKENETTKPTLMLIRVKTEDAANDLLVQIDRYRGVAN